MNFSKETEKYRKEIRKLKTSRPKMTKWQAFNKYFLTKKVKLYFAALFILTGFFCVISFFINGKLPFENIIGCLFFALLIIEIISQPYQNHEQDDDYFIFYANPSVDVCDPAKIHHRPDE